MSLSREYTLFPLLVCGSINVSSVRIICTEGHYPAIGCNFSYWTNQSYCAALCPGLPWYYHEIKKLSLLQDYQQIPLVLYYVWWNSNISSAWSHMRCRSNTQGETDAVRTSGLISPTLSVVKHNCSIFTVCMTVLQCCLRLNLWKRSAVTLLR